MCRYDVTRTRATVADDMARARHGRDWRDWAGSPAWAVVADTASAASSAPMALFGRRRVRSRWRFGPEGPLVRAARSTTVARPQRHDHGGRRRRGRMFAQGELRLLLLEPDRGRTAPWLRADQGDRGDDRATAIRRAPARSTRPCRYWKTRALIREASGSDEPRKAFEVTDKGRAELAERARGGCGNARPARTARGRGRTARRKGSRLRHTGDVPRARQSRAACSSTRRARAIWTRARSRDRRPGRRPRAQDRTALSCGKRHAILPPRCRVCRWGRSHEH